MLVMLRRFFSPWFDPQERVRVGPKVRRRISLGTLVPCHEADAQSPESGLRIGTLRTVTR